MTDNANANSLENTNNNNIISQEQTVDKILKTADYTLNAVKRYRLKNLEKIKEYNQSYIKKKKDEKKKINPYIDVTKNQLYEKIFELEKKVKDFCSRVPPEQLAQDLSTPLLDALYYIC